MFPINFLAVLACAIAAIIIGFVWYGPLFGKQWMKLAGMDKATPEDMEKGKKQMPMMAFLQFVGAFVMAWVLSHVITFMDAYQSVSGAGAGMQAGFWSWLGFVAPTTVGMVLWEGRKWTYWFIVSGCWLVTLLIMGAILGAWM